MTKIAIFTMAPTGMHTTYKFVGFVNKEVTTFQQPVCKPGEPVVMTAQDSIDLMNDGAAWPLTRFWLTNKVKYEAVNHEAVVVHVKHVSRLKATGELYQDSNLDRPVF